MKTPTHDEIAHGAHQLWQDSGCAADRDTENWLEAEQRLGTEHPAAAIDLEVPAAPLFIDSLGSRAAAAAVLEQRHEARQPISPHRSAPKAKPPESGKPLWSQPHSR